MPTVYSPEHLNNDIMAAGSVGRYTREDDPKDVEPRFDSQAAVIDGKLFFYRGILQSYQGKDKTTFPSHFEVFDGEALQWRHVATRGRNPMAFRGIAITSIGAKLYLYGGHDGGTFTDELHEISTLSMEWNRLVARNPNDGPMRKAFCGLISLRGDVLCMFGGYGIRRDGPRQDGSVFIPDTRFGDGQGWSNEVHCFHVQTGMCMDVCHIVTGSISWTHMEEQKINPSLDG